LEFIEKNRRQGIIEIHSSIVTHLIEEWQKKRSICCTYEVPDSQSKTVKNHVFGYEQYILLDLL
jgi:hypothetical protein